LLAGVCIPFTPLLGSTGQPVDLFMGNVLGVLACLSPLGFMRGIEGPNRYGPDPLGRQSPSP
jgi:uncharacterized membrane protein YhaH (DUF805 family)